MQTSNRINDFVQQCQDRGFDPSTAFMLYKELDAIAAPRVLNPERATGKDRQAIEIFQRLGTALLAVQSREDWLRYCSNFSKIVAGRSSDNEIPMTALVTMASDLVDVWAQYVPQESEQNLMERLTIMGPQQGLKLYRQAAEGMTWTRLKMAMAHDAMGTLLGMDDPRLPQSDDSFRTAQTNLDRVLQSTSVRSLRWNWIDGDGPAQRQALAQSLTNAQRELQERTGWDGPVLGLNGRLRLSFGNEHLNDGVMDAFEDRTAMIVTSATKGWTVVSHEWFHAFDQMLSDTRRWGPDTTLSQRWSLPRPLAANEGAAEQRRTERALNALLTTLMIDPGKPQDQQRAWDSARASWGERMLQVHPWATKLVQDEQQRLKKGTWTRKASIDAWRHGIGQHQGTKDPARVIFFAEMVVSEIEFLTTAEHMPSRYGSVWRQFINRFDQNLRRHREVPRGHETLGYFHRPAEALAHSFESTFGGQRSSITDVHAGQTGLRYPTAVEGRHHTKAWRTFFNETRHEWVKICQQQPAQPRIPSRKQMNERLEKTDDQAWACRRPKP